ncbi:MAG: peptide chain release factor N(5)-glutamine methyltransferase [Chloroflexi bacterium]|nr:peptide chain release factor N(5)-glutamine methyltransferase [Chloroflexota bacterium]
MTQTRLRPQPKNNESGLATNGYGGFRQAQSKPPILHLQIAWSLTPETPVGRALVSASQRLNGAGCENPRLDAQVLLAHVLGADRTWLFAHHDHPLTVDQAAAFTDLVARRIRREPVAYLLGRKEFYGLDFAVDERVLIPRPETEMLVDFLLAHVQADAKRTFVVADVGTGSGAIAVTTAVHAPNTRIYGLDISTDALAVARENGCRLAPNARLAFLNSDLLAALPEPADVIVANLPYVTDAEYTDLQPEIREYEPQLALTAGDKGLDVIQRLLGEVRSHLKPNGLVLLEIGHEQGEAVKRLAEEMRPHPQFVGLRQDYSGHVRMVTIEF